MGRLKTKNAGERKTVMLNAKAFASLKHYSAVTGIPLGMAASRAITEWMDVTGAVHIEALTGINTDQLVAGTLPLAVAFPAPSSTVAALPLK